MTAEWVEQPAMPGNEQTVPGKILAAQRETMGWSVEQVADQLKLATRQVVALEAGDYASLPGPAVVRGFVRAYAKVVKLDAVPLVAMIPLEAPAPNDATTTTVRRDKPAAFSEVRFPTNGKRKGLPLGALALGAGALLVAAAGMAWQFDLLPAGLLGGEPAATGAAQTGTLASPVARPAAPEAAPAAAAGADPAPAAAAPEADLSAAQKLSVPLISVTPPAASAPAGAGVAPAATTGAATGPGVLVLKMRDNSWVEVRPEKGAPVLKRLLRRGSTETVTAAGPLTLVVGNPGEVEANWRGAAVALPPAAGSTISRVNLN
ncbi:MAG: helix-turn-helix domain-containing protein [Pseudomonadota bacterium]